MAENAVAAALRTVREPDFDFLDPGMVRVFRDESGKLRLTLEGDRSYFDVKAVRCFPLSDPDGYVGLLSHLDKVIGVLRSVEELEPSSRDTVLDALHHRYFTPLIHRVVRMKEEFGAVYCEVETDHGRREFVARGIRDTLEELGDGHLLLFDVDGNRYCIADWRKLDARSRRLLERIV